jgi:hypothetical protein
MTQEKDLSELEHFDIKITVEGIEITVLVSTKDPLDCITLAGQICSILRASETVKIQGWDKEPKVVILP